MDDDHFFYKRLVRNTIQQNNKKGKLINSVFMFFLGFLPNGNLRRGRRVQVEEEGKAGLVYNKTIDLISRQAFCFYYLCISAVSRDIADIIISCRHFKRQETAIVHLCTKRI